ncbi:MAG TPA: hypothetical protein VD884_14790 [Ohtaekwangia sp.]|nr:hypothetical protein [Ohtaekwangia sp.]
MAKTTTKTTSKAPAKTAVKPTSTDLLETASEEALKKLQSLGVDQQLQSELEWCLGSYRFDKNPKGLKETAGRALKVLNAEKAKKTKGVTVKLLGDLEKALTQ